MVMPTEMYASAVSAGQSRKYIPGTANASVSAEMNSVSS